MLGQYKRALIVKRSLAFCLACSWMVSLAQDPEFTQFFNNPIHLNPAYAGSYGVQGNIVPSPRLVLSHRNQWPAMSGAYVTSGITFDSYVRSLHGGLAFRVLKDDAGRGTLSSTTVAGAYNFRTKIAQGWYMNLALEAAYFQRNLDWDKLSFRDMIDPNQGFIFTTQDIYREGFVKGGDFRAGALFHSKRWSIDSAPLCRLGGAFNWLHRDGKRYRSGNVSSRARRGWQHWPNDGKPRYRI